MPRESSGRDKYHTSFWISKDGYALLDQLAEEMGVPKTAVFEIAIRDLAKQRRVEVQAEKRSLPVDV